MSVNWRAALAAVLTVGAISTLGIAVVNSTGSTPAAPAGTTPKPAAAPAGTPLPTSIMIPDIGVNAKFGPPVILQADGTLGVPAVDMPLVPAWWSQGPKPGDPGPAVAVAHVDGAGQLGLFHDLDKLSIGNQILIGRADGSTIAFTVYKVRTVRKSDFPTQDFYGPTPSPELRLASCLGKFDKTTGQYLDNILVWAKEV